MQFFLIFSEYTSRDFYVAGQSYAGKYAPALAHRIHESNQNSSQVRINLKGIAVGSGFFDPPSQLNYADFYYQVGLIDDFQKSYFEEQEMLTLDLMSAGNWSQAFIVLESLIMGYPPHVGISHLERVTGLKYNVNILLDSEPLENQYFVPFLRQDSVREALHVGSQTFFKSNPKVYSLMHQDIYQSIKPKFLDLLNWNYKVLVYASQFDGIVPYTTVNNFMNSLKWKYCREYSKAARQVWRAGLKGSVAGYKKTAGNLTFIMLRNSGHLVAQDQPEWAFEMMNKFTRNEL
jgi:vitellogenic carboxypeptidase-like protein